MNQELLNVSNEGNNVLFERRKKPKISALSWMNRRVEDKENSNLGIPLNLTDAGKLISQAIDSTKGEWESIFLLRGIIEDLSKETEFSDEFFKKFDYYSKQYIALFYKYSLDKNDNHSLIFSKLNTIFQARNIDIEVFKKLCNTNNIEIHRTFVDRKEFVSKYYDVLNIYKKKIDDLLESLSYQ